VGAAGAQPHLDPLARLVVEGDVLEVAGVEVGVELAVEDARGLSGCGGGISARSCSKSPVMPSISSPGYSSARAAAVSRTMPPSTSNGT
jgi:hypothetical protein